MDTAATLLDALRERDETIAGLCQKLEAMRDHLRMAESPRGARIAKVLDVTDSFEVDLRIVRIRPNHTGDLVIEVSRS